MAMPKARLVVKVERDESRRNGVSITVREGEHGNYGDPYKVGLDDLKGAEILRVGANVGAGDLRSLNTIERFSVIRRKVEAEGYRPSEFVPRPRAEREAITSPPIPQGQPQSLPVPAPLPAPIPVTQLPNVEPETVPEPMTQTAPSGNKLAEALAELMPPAIDVDAVKAEVKAEAMAAVESRLMDVETVRIVISDPLQGIERELPTLRHKDLPKVIQAIGAGVNVFVTGPAGSGKTMMAEQTAEALGKTFYADSFTDDMMRSALYGFRDATGHYAPTALRMAIDSANDESNPAGSLYLADELDNARTSIGAGLNMVLSNTHATFPDAIIPIAPRPMFAAMASANTWGEGATAEYMGRFPIDVSVRSRFPFRVYVDYDLQMERQAALANSTESAHADVSAWIDYAQGVRRRCNEERVKVLITPRELIAGARLLSIGMSLADVKAHTILAGLSDAVITKIGA